MRNESPHYSLVLLLIAVLGSSCGHPVKEAQIKGRIENPVHQMIMIGDTELQIADDGSFHFIQW